jgi:hypothetical protein
MEAGIFAREMERCAALEPEARRQALAGLHGQFLDDYLAALRLITPERARQAGPGGRTIKQVVGHIAEWDRAVIVALGEILAGVTWPRLMSTTLAIDPDGREHRFEGVDAFNAYQAEKQAVLPWKTVQAEARALAGMLHRLYTGPGLLTAARLEDTRPAKFRFSKGENMTLPCGWYLWMITLEHMGVEHAAELGLPP